MLRASVSAARRRRRDIVSIGLVVGYGWSLACLFLAQDAIPSLLIVLFLWLAGLAVVGAVTAWASGARFGRRSPRCGAAAPSRTGRGPPH